MVYADNNATTQIAPEVVEAMTPYLGPRFHNPSSLYTPAAAVSEALQEARRQVARLLGAADVSQVFFTSGATESNNWALFGAAAARPDRKHIVTTAVEHPAVLKVCEELERRGYQLDVLRVNRRGELNTGDFIRALRKDTLFVSVMYANNETGVVFPVADLARLTKEVSPDILFHTDATQAVGKLPMDLDGALRQVDLLSLSGHKLHAPKGVGALFLRHGAPVRPFLFGGHQESGLRAGTENVPHVVGLGAACRLALEHMDDETRIRALRDRLEHELAARIPCLEVNGAGAERLPNTLNLAAHYIEGESILYQLDAHGICASSGSACTSGSLEPSHVLRALGVPFTAIHGSVRFSFSRYNTAADVEHILAVFPDIVAALRRVSPYWDTKLNRPRDTAPGAEALLRRQADQQAAAKTSQTAGAVHA